MAVENLAWEKLDWLIYDAESGKNFRPYDLNWARETKAKCDEFGVAFFYKQGNSYKSETDIKIDGEIIQKFPAAKLDRANKKSNLADDGLPLAA